jgi:hypothetical protein
VTTRLVAAASTRRRRRLVARTPVIAPGAASRVRERRRRQRDRQRTRGEQKRTHALHPCHTPLPSYRTFPSKPRPPRGPERLTCESSHSTFVRATGVASGTKAAHADSTVKTPLISQDLPRAASRPSAGFGSRLRSYVSDRARVALGVCGNPSLSAEPHGERALWRLVPWLRPFMLANRPSRPSGEWANHCGSTVKIAPIPCSTNSACGRFVDRDHAQLLTAADRDHIADRPVRNGSHEHRGVGRLAVRQTKQVLEHRPRSSHAGSNGRERSTVTVPHRSCS